MYKPDSQTAGYQDMRKPKDVPDLAEKFAVAAATPVRAPVRPKSKSVGIFLRLPGELHEALQVEAVARTKKAGVGITIQQIILERLRK